MAGIVMHNRFFSECINNSALRSRTKKKSIDNIFCQGHDSFLYIQPWNFFTNRNISLILSNYKFVDFVFAYICLAQQNGSIQDEDVRRYIYGYISHHVLDSHFHPYIMQYCSDYLPVKNKPWLHGAIETLFDAYFISRDQKITPKQYKLYQDFCSIEITNPHFFQNFDQAIVLTYGITGCGDKLKLYIKQVENYVHLFRYDPLGVKKKIGALADRFVHLGVRNFFYDNDFENLKCYLNEERKEWSYYFSLEDARPIKSRDSFEDIYATALRETITIIDELERLIPNADVHESDIAEIIPDRSAITGLPCGRKLSFVKHQWR